MSLGLRTSRVAGALPLSLRPARPLVRAALRRPAPSSTTNTAYSTSSLRTPNGARHFGRRFNSSSASGEPPKSAYERMKDLTKTYGSYAVIMYLALSAVDFSLSFAVVHAVGVERIEPYTHQLVKWYRQMRYGKDGAAALEAADKARKLADEADAAAETVLAAGKKEPWYLNRAFWAEVALAYSIHKVGLLPVRAGLTVAWTPKVVNWLRARGWIGTSGAKRAMQHGSDKVRGAIEQAKDAAKNASRK